MCPFFTCAIFIISIISGRKGPGIYQALSSLFSPYDDIDQIILCEHILRLFVEQSQKRELIIARKKRASQDLLFKNNLGGLDVFIIIRFDKVNSAS
jgi:hypothetical protein